MPPRGPVTSSKPKKGKVRRKPTSPRGPQGLPGPRDSSGRTRPAPAPKSKVSRPLISQVTHTATSQPKIKRRIRQSVKREQANLRVSGDRPTPGGRTNGINARKGSDYRAVLKYLIDKQAKRLDFTPSSNHPVTEDYLHNLRQTTRGKDGAFLRNGRPVSTKDPSHPLARFFAQARKGQREGQEVSSPAASVATGWKKLTGDNIFTRGLTDAVDLPANTVTSTYLIGKAAATGHPLKAGKMLVDPIVETAKHPLKSFNEHPTNTLLIARGAKGAVGHGAGKVMRSGAVGKRARRAASTARAPKVIPGSKRVVRRQYSKDVITRTGQAAWDRRKERLARERGHVAHVAKPKDIRRAIDEDVQAAKIVTQHNQSKVADEARDAIAPKKGRIRRQKPTVATSLAAQGITDVTKSDLQAYLSEVRAAEPKLQGKRLAANRETQKLIKKALENHDPVEVARARDAYQAFSARLDAKVISRGLVDERVATDTRLQAPKARRVKVPAKDELAARKDATRLQKQAKRAMVRAENQLSEVRTAVQEVTAAERRARTPQERATIQAAEDKLTAAREHFEHAKASAYDAKAAHIRASRLTAGEEPAYVSHQALEARTPALPTKPVDAVIKKQRKGAAVKEGSLDVHPAKLVEQAVSTQRLVDSADARARFFDDYSYRPQRGGDPAAFGNNKAAEAFARKHLNEGEWTPVRRDDGKHVLVPSEAWKRAKEHQSSVNAQGKLLSATGAQWRRNVLAFSPRWLIGNQLEGAMRSVIARSGPLSYVTAKKVLGRLDPETRAQVEARTISGGNYEAANRISNDRIIRRDPTAQDLGRIASALYKLRETPGPRHLADAYAAYTDIVFRAVNGRMETQFQTAMLGKALRDHPLMSERVRKLSDEAVREAAEGLKDTATQAELGRLVDDMYGRYGKFSPGLRSAVSNYTPFAAWTINATRFLTVVLPRDHPVLTALLASANEATEDMRKRMGLFYDPMGRAQGQRAPYLQGGGPHVGDIEDRVLRTVTKGSPFGLFNSGIESAHPLEGFSSLLLPQATEIMANVFHGKDWKGKDLADHPNAVRDAIAGVASFIEGQVPLASQAISISGVRTPNMADSDSIEPGLGNRLSRTLSPIRSAPKPRKKKKVRVRSSSSSSSSKSGGWSDSGGWGDSGSGSGSSGWSDNGGW